MGQSSIFDSEFLRMDESSFRKNIFKLGALARVMSGNLSLIMLVPRIVRKWRANLYFSSVEMSMTIMYAPLVELYRLVSFEAKRRHQSRV